MREVYAESGTVRDEALTGRAQEKVFRPRTKTILKTWTAAARSRAMRSKGRNNWIVWTGGNDRFWDYLVTRALV